MSLVITTDVARVPMGRPFNSGPARPTRPTRPARVNPETGETEIRCTKCDQWKPIRRFYVLRNPASRSGRNSWCAQCMNIRRNAARRAALAAAKSQAVHA